MNTKSSAIAHKSDFKGASSRGFEASNINGFIVFNGAEYFAYENKCPHTGAPLDWVEHQFLDAEGVLIQCAVHDARFEIETGVCIFGPCSGKQLCKLPITIIGDKIYIAPLQK